MILSNNSMYVNPFKQISIETIEICLKGLISFSAKISHFLQKYCW